MPAKIWGFTSTNSATSARSRRTCSMSYSSFCQCRSIDSLRQTEAFLRNVTGRCLRSIYEKSTRTVAPMWSSACMSHCTKWQFFPRDAVYLKGTAWWHGALESRQIRMVCMTICSGIWSIPPELIALIFFNDNKIQQNRMKFRKNSHFLGVKLTSGE